MSELNLILLGPPGAGKGTQAERLEQDFHLLYVSTGNMLREARRDGSELGKRAAEYMDRGDLVPDEIIIECIIVMVEKDGEDGFLLDGFPRSIGQAEALETELGRLHRRLTAAVLIDAPDEEVVRRLSGRRTCTKNPSHIYHVDFDPPKHEGVCDQDGARLEQRDDDKPETVEKRLEVYHAQTEPLIAYYEERGLLRRFDGTRHKDEVHGHIRATIATLRLEDQM